MYLKSSLPELSNPTIVRAPHDTMPFGNRRIDNQKGAALLTKGARRPPDLRAIVVGLAESARQHHQVEDVDRAVDHRKRVCIVLEVRGPAVGAGHRSSLERAGPLHAAGSA